MADIAQMPPRSPLATAKQVAEYLRVPEGTVLRMARAGTIPGAKVGPSSRLWRFRMEDIEAWVKDQIDKSKKDKAS